MYVITSDAEGLARFCPGTIPVPSSKMQWLTGGPLLPDRVAARMPRRLKEIEHNWERRMETSFPETYERLCRLKRTLGSPASTSAPVMSVLQVCDALVVSGMGGFTDVFEGNALRMLRLLQLGLRLGKEVVLFGQGIGPIAPSSRLWVEAAATFPRVGRICLREGVFGPDLLSALRVDMSRVAVTGDDALELVAGTGTGGTGRGVIGVNLRVASHSGIAREEARMIGETLSRVARAIGLRILPIPIALYRGASDEDALFGIPGVEDAARGASAIEPSTVIKRIGQADMVVTCSYHAAVFALGQGVPAIGLASNGYYRHKFYGISGQFPGGCIVLDPRGPHFAEQLRRAVELSMQTRRLIGEGLREQAARQVQDGRAAYSSAVQFIEDRVTRKAQWAGTLADAAS